MKQVNFLENYERQRKVKLFERRDLKQGRPHYGPRALSGPPTPFLWPESAEWFCHFSGLVSSHLNKFFFGEIHIRVSLYKRCSTKTVFEEYQVVFLYILVHKRVMKIPGWLLILQVHPNQLSRTSLAGHFFLCTVTHNAFSTALCASTGVSFVLSAFTCVLRSKRCCKAYKMLPKKRKIDSECRKYNEY